MEAKGSQYLKLNVYNIILVRMLGTVLLMHLRKL